MSGLDSCIFNTGENDMSIKALIRKWTGRGGAINRATSTCEVCRLSALAMAAKITVWDLD